MSVDARRDLVQAVRAALSAAGDPERAAGQQRYMKSAMPCHGLSAPQLQATLRPVLGGRAYRVETRGEWEATVRCLWDEATHREQRYAATAPARHRAYRAWRDVDTLDLYWHMVVTGAWWDHVDEIAVHLVGSVLALDPANVSPLMRRWAVADDLWLRRAAILSQLGAKGATDADLLGEVIQGNLVGSTFGSEFFVRKAIGWALREHAKTDPAWVRSFVVGHKSTMSPLSQREALKHL